MTDEELAVVLLDDFNSYRARTRTQHTMRQRNPFAAKPLVPSKDRLALFQMCIAWCRERGLEPRQWVLGLFRVRRWIAPPKPTQGCLMSEAMIPKVKRLPKSKVFELRVLATSAAAQAAAATDPRVDLIHHVEAYKDTLGDHSLWESCFIRPEETLGYHPKSKACSRCPLQADCAVRLCSMFSFDVISARRAAKDL